ncbi:MAG: 50S ribosomal protein L29 [Chthoniobacterales bacterium]
MKINEIRELTVDELRTRKRELSREAFNLRMQKAGGQLEKPHLIHSIRRDVARIESLITEKSKKA